MRTERQIALVFRTCVIDSMLVPIYRRPGVLRRSPETVEQCVMGLTLSRTIDRLTGRIANASK